MTIGKSSAASNPFVARAQQEEQSRRVPLNQLQPSPNFSAATGGTAPPTAGSVAPASSTVWPTLAVVYSPVVQPGYNPFL